MAASSPNPDTTYTAMDTADLDSIGQRCEFAYCNQLDFLPFRCDSCHHTYCLDHRTETSHKCAHAGAWAANRRKNSIGRNGTTSSLSGHLSHKPTLRTATQCSNPTCKTFINTTQSQAIHCPTCNREYCLKHRLRESHSCATLTPLGARPAAGPTNSEKVKSGFARLKKTWSAARQEALKPKPKPTSQAARTAALNDLKRNARGDDKVPAEKRVYLHVEAEAASTTSKLPRAEVWFSSEWSVGRVLDDAARRLQVVNENNRAESEERRLRVYHVEAGRLLEFNEKLGKVVVSGNTVVLLRGVGPVEEG